MGYQTIGGFQNARLSGKFKHVNRVTSDPQPMKETTQ